MDRKEELLELMNVEYKFVKESAKDHLKCALLLYALCLTFIGCPFEVLSVISDVLFLIYGLLWLFTKRRQKQLEYEIDGLTRIIQDK